MTNAFGAKQNVDAALEALRIGLSPFVTEQMKKRHGTNWRQFASPHYARQVGECGLNG